MCGDVAPRWLSEQSVSEMTEIPVNTLRDWRKKQTGPPFSKIGRLVRYNEAAVNEWMLAHQVFPELSPGTDAGRLADSSSSPSEG